RSLDEAVEPRDDRLRLVVLERERSEGGPEPAHHWGGPPSPADDDARHARAAMRSFADAVADDEPEPAVVELDHVVPVAADVDADRAGEVAGGEADAGDRRKPLGKHAARTR